MISVKSSRALLGKPPNLSLPSQLTSSQSSPIHRFTSISILKGDRLPFTIHSESRIPSMRRKPFKPPYRRWSGDEPSSNHPYRRGGVVDQRLIEEAQLSSPFFSQFWTNDDGDGDGARHRRRGLGSGSLALKTYTGVEGGEGEKYGEQDTDMQLDAFGEYHLINTVATLC